MFFQRRQIANDALHNVNSFQEDGFVQKLIVVVQQDGSKVHGREAERWDLFVADESGIRGGWEDLNVEFHTQIVGCLLESGPPRVFGGINVGDHRYVISIEAIQRHIVLCSPSVELRSEGDQIHARTDANINRWWVSVAVAMTYTQ